MSITQSTEVGTVYTPDEIRALADTAHELDMYLHMDGARICNAAAALGVELRETTGDCGVDVLSFGGTKNGIVGGEAVVFFRPELAGNALYIRKQEMQLASKMRFISAQFLALLRDDLWRHNATHANAMARRLADAVRDVEGVVAHPAGPGQRGLRRRCPREAVAPLQERVPLLRVGRGHPRVSLDVLLGHHRGRRRPVRRGHRRARPHLRLPRHMTTVRGHVPQNGR